MKRSSNCSGAVLAAVFSAAVAIGQPLLAQAGKSPPANYLGFANGAVPVALEGDAEALGLGPEKALLAIDGDEGAYTLTLKPGGAGTRLILVYKLPALTTFREFAVPNVLETPSASQTFVRSVEVAGSDQGPGGPFQKLASATLATHAAKGQRTTFPAVVEKPVRWVRLTLAGGIEIPREKAFLDFSEIIGHGSQVPVPRSTAFTGQWQGRGVRLELKQEGAIVTGCYDGEGELRGDVSGNLLRATGRTRRGIASAFVLAVDDSKGITGVRSSNGAPFRLYNGEAAPAAKTQCALPSVPPPGCGSILHGIHFDYDSDAIRRESGPLLDALAAGLKTANAAGITVLGHTSDEGADTYNKTLSQRRARAVVAAMAARGIDARRMQPEGRGEETPIADNATEAGRSMNRRVEIVCR